VEPSCCRLLLQCVAVCCSVLQCVVVCCTCVSFVVHLCCTCVVFVLIDTSIISRYQTRGMIEVIIHHNTLYHTTTHFSSLQLTATHCNTLQYTAPHHNKLLHTVTHIANTSKFLASKLILSSLDHKQNDRVWGRDSILVTRDRRDSNYNESRFYQ